MQMHSSTTGLRISLIILICLILIVAACGQPSAPVAEAPPQPTIYTPTIIVEFLMPGDILGIVVDENIKVLRVEPGNAAERAGVQEGDVLESLDGISFKDKDKVKEKIREPKEGKKFKLKLKRNDQDVEVDISPAPPAYGPPDNNTPTPVWPPQDYL